MEAIMNASEFFDSWTILLLGYLFIVGFAVNYCATTFINWYYDCQVIQFNSMLKAVLIVPFLTCCVICVYGQLYVYGGVHFSSPSYVPCENANHTIFLSLTSRGIPEHPQIFWNEHQDLLRLFWTEKFFSSLYGLKNKILFILRFILRYCFPIFLDSGFELHLSPNYNSDAHIFKSDPTLRNIKQHCISLK